MWNPKVIGPKASLGAFASTTRNRKKGSFIAIDSLLGPTAVEIRFHEEMPYYELSLS